jgi:galactitol-specific phosphotransferase system IIB component
MATRINNEVSKTILRSVEELLDISEVAESVEFTIKVDKTAIPTLSYKVDNCHIFARTTHMDNDFRDRFMEKFKEVKGDNNGQKEN